MVYGWGAMKAEDSIWDLKDNNSEEIEMSNKEQVNKLKDCADASYAMLHYINKNEGIDYFLDELKARILLMPFYPIFLNFKTKTKIFLHIF